MSTAIIIADVLHVDICSCLDYKLNNSHWINQKLWEIKILLIKKESVTSWTSVVLITSDFSKPLDEREQERTLSLRKVNLAFES